MESFPGTVSGEAVTMFVVAVAAWVLVLYLLLRAGAPVPPGDCGADTPADPSRPAARNPEACAHDENLTEKCLNPMDDCKTEAECNACVQAHTESGQSVREFCSRFRLVEAAAPAPAPAPPPDAAAAGHDDSGPIWERLDAITSVLVALGALLEQVADNQARVCTIIDEFRTEATDVLSAVGVITRGDGRLPELEKLARRRPETNIDAEAISKLILALREQEPTG